MHPNPIYRQTETTQNLAFARERGFGVMSINGAEGPHIAHIPFVLSADGTGLEAHMVRSNPLWRALETPQPAVMVVSGADGYISPDWYGMEDQVPTWNYVAVHLRGVLRRLDHDELLACLDRLSEEFETRLLPKPIWRTSKMPEQVRDKMLRMIMPVAMDITDVQGTWKFSQNKPAHVPTAAADQLEASGFGQEVSQLAALMRRFDPSQR